MTRERVGRRVGGHGRDVSVCFCVCDGGCEAGSQDKIGGFFRGCDGDWRLLRGLSHRYLVHSGDFCPHSEEVGSLWGPPRSSGELLLHDVITRVEILFPALTGYLTSQEIFVGEKSVRIFRFKFCFCLDRRPLSNGLRFWYKLALNRHLNK